MQDGFETSAVGLQRRCRLRATDCYVTSTRLFTLRAKLVRKFEGLRRVVLERGAIAKTSLWYGAPVMTEFRSRVLGVGFVVAAIAGCQGAKREFGTGGGTMSAGDEGGDDGVINVGGTTNNGGISSVGATNHGGEGGNAETETLPNVCVPAQAVCDRNRATTCNAEGTGYVASGLKCSSTQVCLLGACEEQECEPGKTFCSGSTVRTCDEDGLSSVEVMPCGSDEYCDVASASCQVGVCAPDQPACDGKRATLCNSLGDGYVAGGTACGVKEICDAGECKTQVCTPGESFCQGQTVKTCSDSGLSSSVDETCEDQTCVATGGAAACQGECAPDQQDCASNGVRTCNAEGKFGSPSKCTNKTCVVSGKLASCVGECAPGQAKCSGNGSIQSCDASGEYGAAMACAAAKPYCYSDSCNAEPPSCNGLSANCGPSANESCCVSPAVSGGAFNRDNDSSVPATISNFKLDKYEVTVGRFRKFVAAVLAGFTPAAGSGKHTHISGGAGLLRAGATGSEPGWDATWNSYLPITKAAWDGTNNLACDSTYQTWTPNSSGNELRPINCVSWHQAAAFCIWDHGFLPSEAEWNYAAAGGSQQRQYPWSAPASSTTIDCSYANYYGAAGGDYCVLPGTGATSVVGSFSPKGDGRFGQADLAGNLSEWVLDEHAAYVASCTNCAQLAGQTFFRSIRGGGFMTDSSYERTSFRNSNALRDYGIGVRCARTP